MFSGNTEIVCLKMMKKIAHKDAHFVFIYMLYFNNKFLSYFLHIFLEKNQASSKITGIYLRASTGHILQTHLVCFGLGQKSSSQCK